MKRGLKKTFNTALLAGALYLLPIIGFSQSPEDSEKKEKTKMAQGRAIVAPKAFDHPSYAKVRFVNNEIGKDTTFYANHMGVIKYKIPVDLNKKNTKYNLFISPGYNKQELGRNEKGEDFVPYERKLSFKKGQNDFKILDKSNLEKKVADSK
ncbi:MAG TPA: hypothetical protein VJ912_00725 [Candidatus Nanoarchaeia archaeon]|nr:hypothetical protein [Candidatus Nanoarchaeia archaeon]